MKSIKEELDEFRKNIREKSPNGFDSRDLMGSANTFLPTGLEPLPKRDYQQEYEDIKLDVIHDLKKVFFISTTIENPMDYPIIKAQIELDQDSACRLKHLILVEQSKMYELMDQMDIFPAEVPFHGILVKVQERLSASIETYDNYLKKCGINYSKLMEQIDIKLTANQQEESNSESNIENVGMMNHRQINDLIHRIKAQNIPS